jgi:hypothetical protein
MVVAAGLVGATAAGWAQPARTNNPARQRIERAIAGFRLAAIWHPKDDILFTFRLEAIILLIR